jgi:MFS family permease
MMADAKKAETGVDDEERRATARLPIQHDNLVLSFFSRPRALYWTVFCWVSVSGGRFLALFLENVAQLSSTEIGLVLALQQLVMTALAPWATSLADAREQNHPCQGRVHVVACGIVLGTAAFLLHNLVSHTWMHMALQVVYAAAGCLIWPVLDGITIGHLRSDGNDDGNNDGGRQDEYGRERLFGAVSWAITNLGLSYALDLVGFPIMYPLTVLAALGALASLWAFVRLQKPKSASRPPPRPGADPRFTKRSSDVIHPDHAEEDLQCLAQRDSSIDARPRDLSTIQSFPARDASNDSRPTQDGQRVPLWRMFEVMVGSKTTSCAFVFYVFCLAIGQVLVDSLVFLLFEVLGSSYTTMGWTVVLTVLFEVPIFAAAPFLLERLGTSILLLLASVCYAVRVLAYGAIPQGRVLYALLVEPLHGVTYACSQTAAVHFFARNVRAASSAPGSEAAAQGILQVVKGAGSVLGLALGGLATDTVGPRAMYRASAGIVALGSTVLFFVCFCRPTVGDRKIPNQHHRVPTTCFDDGNLSLELPKVATRFSSK